MERELVKAAEKWDIDKMIDLVQRGVEAETADGKTAALLARAVVKHPDLRQIMLYRPVYIAAFLFLPLDPKDKLG